MEKYIYDNSNGLWYALQGDYYIPCLTLPEECKPIGIWGQRHKSYLKEYRKATYTTMLTEGKLNTYLPILTGRRRNALNGLIEDMKLAQGIYRVVKDRKRPGMDGENESYSGMCDGDFCITLLKKYSKYNII